MATVNWSPRVRISWIVSLTFFKAVGAANIDPTGFYIGAGTGLSIVQNYGLTKTYHTRPAGGDPSVEYNPLSTQYIGNTTGYSLPFSMDLGYRFNKYLGTEFTYVYSGNQHYQRASQDVTGSNFWGSQNTFALAAIGYLPILNNVYLKGRAGIAYSVDSMTTFVGNPGTKNLTSELGVGIQWMVLKHMSLDFDYINFGLLKPMELRYTPPNAGGPNLGVVDTLISNNFLLSVNYHF